jgi:heme/copper-type cytochrome/quinol oxidase subunit 2
MGGARTAHASRPVDIAWAILPAIGLALVLYLTWRAVGAAREPSATVTHSGVAAGA